MGIAVIQAKSVLQKSGIPGIAYVINPYTGCTHGCVYRGKMAAQASRRESSERL